MLKLGLISFAASDLRLENTGVEELDKLLINTLFKVKLFPISHTFLPFLVGFYLPKIYSSLQAVHSESRNSPFILFMKDAEKSLVGNQDSYSSFKSRLERLPDNVVVIGSHTQTDSRKEKVMVV